MKSLKEILKDFSASLNIENYENDKYIIMTWIQENFNVDLVDFINLIFKKELENLAYLNRSYIEHQSFNATTFSTLIVDNLYETYKKEGVIHNSTYPLFISLLRMYKDGNWDYKRIHPNLKEIIVNCFIDENGAIQINDPEIVAWIKEGIKNG